MENIYFKGLDKALNDDCYIKVFNCAFNYPAVRVEKKNRENGEKSLYSYGEGVNVISALNIASCKIVDELGDKKDNIYSSESTLIDRVLTSGYTLHFYKLSNGQVLSTICCFGSGLSYIPVKSIISDDVQTGFKLLNASLEYFVDNEQSHNFYNNFYAFVVRQTAPVKALQRSLIKDSK